MIWLARTLACMMLAACFATPAKALDTDDTRCNEVLDDASLWTPELRERNPMKLLAYSRFMRAAVSDLVNPALGFGQPLGEWVFRGAAYDEARVSAKKQGLQKDMAAYGVPARMEIDAALTTGDPNLLSAWQACATRQQRLTIRFEPQSPRDVFAIVQLYGPAGLSTALAEDAELPPGVTAVSGAKCLQQGHQFTVGTPCSLVLNVSDAGNPMLLALHEHRGLVMGYLPARVRLNPQKRAFQFAPNCKPTEASAPQELERCKDRLFKRVYAERATMEHMVSIAADLPSDMSRDGWTFDEKSAGLDIVTIAKYSPSNTSKCWKQAWTVTPLTYKYSYQLWSGIEQQQSAWIACRVEPRIEISRDAWVPEI